MNKLSRWQRFRRSRWALLLNVVLLPVLIPISVIWHGLPKTWEGLLDAPRFVIECWKEATWKV